VLVRLGSCDIEDGIFPFRDLEDEDDTGGGSLDGTLGVERQGFVGVPVTTGAVECFDHVGVLGVAGKRLPVDQSDGEFNDLPPGLEADQDDSMAGANAQLKVAVGE
jgi:hypothetical protein